LPIFQVKILNYYGLLPDSRNSLILEFSSLNVEFPSEWTVAALCEFPAIEEYFPAAPDETVAVKDLCSTWQQVEAFMRSKGMMVGKYSVIA
jgi:hypothetical protein